MAEPKPWAPGDPCPSCSDDLRPVPAASAAQRAAAANKDNPMPIPPTADHAPEEFIAEFGDLHRCRGCGYQARVPRKKTPAAAGADDAVPAPRAPRARKKTPAAAGESK